jgi:hypothetical protein
MQKKKLFLDLMYRYSNGDKLYQNSKSLENLVEYNHHSIDLFGNYGITNFISVDFYLNYNIRSLTQYGFRTKGYGFSNIFTGIRYNLYESENSDILVMFGGGIKIPLMKFKPIEQYPIIVQPSSGSFGFYAFGTLQKSIQKYDINFLLYSRFDYNFRNSLNYHFGPSLSNSLFVSHRLGSNFVVLAELKYLHFVQDKFNDTVFTNSGGNYLAIAPRISYTSEKVNISPFVEIPLYQNYNGEQVGMKFSFGINFNYFYNLSRKRI